MRRLSFLVAAALALAACSAAASEQDQLEEAIAEVIQNEFASAEGVEDVPINFDEDESLCVAEGFVETVGYDNLVDAGFTPESVRSGGMQQLENLSSEINVEDLDDEVALQMLDCVNLGEVFTSMFTADLGLDDDSAECLSDGLIESGGIEEMMDSLVTGGGQPDIDDPQLGALFLSLFSECLDGEDLAGILGG